MINMKNISVVALILLIVGIIGSALTFKSAYQAEDIIKTETILGEEIENLDIKTNNTRVDVLPTNDQDINIELSTKNSHDQLLTEVNGSTLLIQVKNKKRQLIQLDFFSFGSTLTVYVPEKVYHSFQIDTHNGRVTVDQLQASDVTVKADNGKIELENMISDTVTGQADNGEISMKNINSSTTQVKTSNGRINLDHVEGKVFGRTNNGSITLVTEHLDRSIEFEADNGIINIQTEKEPTNAILDVRVDNGKVRVFGNSNWDTIIGNGEHLIKLVMNNGNITISK